MSVRILLVDDNQIQAATRRTILEGCGHEVSVALNGKQALDMLNEAEPSKATRLVITDHLMPIMSGPEFVTELRKRGSTIPVVVLSGLPEAEAAYEGLNAHFKLKPLNPESLIQLVKDLSEKDMRRSA